MRKYMDKQHRKNLAKMSTWLRKAEKIKPANSNEYLKINK